MGKRQRANKPLPGERKIITTPITKNVKSINPLHKNIIQNNNSTKNSESNSLLLKPKPKLVMAANNTVISTESQNYLKKSQIQINQTLSAKSNLSSSTRKPSEEPGSGNMRKCSVNSEALDLAIDQQLGEINPSIIAKNHKSVNVENEEGEIEDDRPRRH